MFLEVSQCLYQLAALLWIESSGGLVKEHDSRVFTGQGYQSLQELPLTL